MIVTFQKLFCVGCQKIRLHEVVVTPCCVVCSEYNLNEPIADPTPVWETMEIERFN